MGTEPITSDPMTQRRRWVDDGRRCITCRWVEVKPCSTPGRPLGLGCTHPMACYGQAGEGKSCCSWEREPGADDDELPTWRI